MSLPGQIVTNWNFQLLPVSNMARDILTKLNYRPLFQTLDFSKNVLQRQTYLIECSKLRYKGHLMFPYVQWCQDGVCLFDCLFNVFKN